MFIKIWQIMVLTFKDYPWACDRWNWWWLSDKHTRSVAVKLCSDYNVHIIRVDEELI